MQLNFKKNNVHCIWTIVNCYALATTGRYSVFIFRIPTVFDVIPLELVRFRNTRFSVSSRSFSCPALPFSFSFSYSNVKVENSWGVFRPFPSVFILNCTCACRSCERPPWTCACPVCSAVKNSSLHAYYYQNIRRSSTQRAWKESKAFDQEASTCYYKTARMYIDPFSSWALGSLDQARGKSTTYLLAMHCGGQVVA